MSWSRAAAAFSSVPDCTILDQNGPGIAQSPSAETICSQNNFLFQLLFAAFCLKNRISQPDFQVKAPLLGRRDRQGMATDSNHSAFQEDRKLESLISVAWKLEDACSSLASMRFLLSLARRKVFVVQNVTRFPSHRICIAGLALLSRERSTPGYCTQVRASLWAIPQLPGSLKMVASMSLYNATLPAHYSRSLQGLAMQHPRRNH